MQGKKRVAWIDSVKALAIVLIVVGHALNGYSNLWHWVYGFHVPLFVMLSGLVFNRDTSMDFKSFIKKNILNTLVPYYFWGIVSIIIYQVVGTKIDGQNAFSLIDCFKGLLWANGQGGRMRWNLPMWFLPVIFLIKLFGYHLNKIKKTNTLVFVVGLQLFISFFTYTSGVISNLPFGLETAIYLSPFFSCGLLLSGNIGILHKIDIKVKVLCSVALAIIGSVIILYQKNIDYVSDVYRSYPLFFISAGIMSLSLIVLFSGLDKCPKPIGIIGQNTMAIMILQRFPLIFFEKVCPITKDIYITNRFVGALLIAGLTIVLCVLVSIALKRILPWSLGVRRQ